MGSIRLRTSRTALSAAAPPDRRPAHSRPRPHARMTVSRTVPTATPPTKDSRMRKLSILLVMLGVLWLGATAGAGAWAADDSPVAQTTVSTRDVTPKGEPLQRRDRTEARAVPDRTNLVSVTWKGDPSAAFRVETRSTDGEWIDRGEVSQAVDLPDAGTADARRVAATTSGIASQPILVKNTDEVRLRLADGIATDVDVTAFAPTAPPGLLPISQTAAMVPGIGLIGVGGA